MPELRFESVSFGYRRSKAVLEQFSWAVPPGRTVLLGPNGAGKTTLLALAADAIGPQSGRICFGELEANRRRRRVAYRRAIGWMPQQVRAVPAFNAREQVAYAGWLKGLSQRQAWAAAARALDQVGLADLASQKASTLSGGQLRRVGLAQLLVHEAEVLLLDEPTVGLDPAQRARFRQLLAELDPRRVVIVSTHQVDDLSELFDTAVVLHEGQLKFSGPIGAFMELAPPGSPRPAEAAYARIVGGET